jgi:uncharacterized protein YjbI with pentapeptide repeats
MATKVDRRTTLENFRELAKLARPATKTILTCRTHYFKTETEATNLLSKSSDTALMAELRQRKNFSFVFLREFDEFQIKAFLQKHTSDWHTLLAKIHSTYNLEDLAKRPILLEIIVKTLPKINITSGAINSTSLYDTYTDFWIQHEDWRSTMTCEEKEFFTMELAYQMFTEGSEEVHFSKLSIPLKHHFSHKIQTHTDLDYFDNDIRTCSFLNRDGAGNYRFIHKSFMEYFVAKRIRRSASGDFADILSRSILTKEICHFIKDTPIDSKVLLDILKNAKANTASRGCEVANALIILVTQGVNFTGYDFSDLNLSGATLDGGDFNGAIFKNCNLEKVSARNGNFSNAIFDNANVSSSEFSQSYLKDTQWRNIRAEKCRFVGANLSDSNMQHVSFQGANFSGAYLNRVHFLDTEFSDATLTKCKMRHSSVVKSYFKNCRMRSAKILSAIFEGTSIKGTDLTGTNFSNAQLTNCILQSCNLNEVNLNYSILEGVEIHEMILFNRISSAKDIKIIDVVGLSLEEEAIVSRLR